MAHWGGGFVAPKTKKLQVKYNFNYGCDIVRGNEFLCPYSYHFNDTKNHKTSKE